MLTLTSQLSVKAFFSKPAIDAHVFFICSKSFSLPVAKISIRLHVCKITHSLRSACCLNDEYASSTLEKENLSKTWIGDFRNVTRAL